MKGRIEQFLPRVAKPARYTGGELNSICKPPRETSVRIALAFPDVYEVGMSNLGLRILYHVLNSQGGIAAERVFAPALDMESEMRGAGVPLFSLESSLPVRDFDVVGFSLSYEMSYTTVLNMLDLAGIPVFARDRSDRDPIVIAGGHCASNPEPMADFIDAFAIGDGEEVVLDIVREYKAHRPKRGRVLEALSEIRGVYVPSVHAQGEDRTIVCSRVVADLENAPYPDRLVVPFTEAVHDRVAVEIMRGCGRGCRFCQAGMITRPVRERSVETLCGQANTLLENTGYEEIALTSLSSADYSQIDWLVRTLVDAHERDRVGISLPSLRADARCVRLAHEIRRVRKSGLTFAPEAGTARLRDAINKNVTEQDLLEAVECAVQCGWRHLKLYFMIGLPTETDDDVRGIADLVSRVVKVGRKHERPLTLNLTISPFVPKPHTPFQWRAMASPEELERKISLLRPLPRGRNISLSWHDPRCSRVEAALARGDRNVSAAIYESWKTGGNLEQDRFDYDRWLTAFGKAGLDIADYANTELPKDAHLAWDHIDVGVSREFLWSENEKADYGETTTDCRFGECSGCGIRESLAAITGKPTRCSTLSPSSAEAPPSPSEEVMPPSPSPLKEVVPPSPSRLGEAALESPSPLGEGRGEVTDSSGCLFAFRKSSDLRWLGHLDLMRVFERAVRMSGIDVMYTRGFNPRAKMSIASALPLGATAEHDLITIHIADPVDLKEVISRLNQRLPDGLALVEGAILPEHGKMPVVAASEFIVEVFLPEENAAAGLEKAIEDVMSASEIVVERESKKKRKTIDIRPGIGSLSVLDRPTLLTARLAMTLPHREFTVKPSEVVHALRDILPGLELVSIHRLRLVTHNS